MAPSTENRRFGLRPLRLLLCLALCLAACAGQTPKPYGVFIGLDGGEAEKLRDYRLAVIEPSAFSGEEIARLRSGGTRVYGYLNVGALESYRPYYSRFAARTLAPYENWPDERWVDVADPDWQAFVVGELGAGYAALGLDGFFLDNADVYDHYPSEACFQGLCAILRGLKGNGLPLVLNGGDRFVTRCIEEGGASALFDGVNQECVFTEIDFKNGSYGPRERRAREYFQAYLERAKDAGLAVYLLEYGADKALAEQIEAYCAERGFAWYNAQDLELR